MYNLVHLHPEDCLDRTKHVSHDTFYPRRRREGSTFTFIILIMAVLRALVLLLHLFLSLWVAPQFDECSGAGHFSHRYDASVYSGRNNIKKKPRVNSIRLACKTSRRDSSEQDSLLLFWTAIVQALSIDMIRIMACALVFLEVVGRLSVERKR